MKEEKRTILERQISSLVSSLPPEEVREQEFQRILQRMNMPLSTQPAAPHQATRKHWDWRTFAGIASIFLLFFVANHLFNHPAGIMNGEQAIQGNDLSKNPEERLIDRSPSLAASETQQTEPKEVEITVHKTMQALGAPVYRQYTGTVFSSEPMVMEVLSDPQALLLQLQNVQKLQLELDDQTILFRLNNSGSSLDPLYQQMLSSLGQAIPCTMEQKSLFLQHGREQLKEDSRGMTRIYLKNAEGQTIATSYTTTEGVLIQLNSGASYLIHFDQQGTRSTNWIPAIASIGKQLQGWQTGSITPPELIGFRQLPTLDQLQVVIPLWSDAERGYLLSYQLPEGNFTYYVPEHASYIQNLAPADVNALYSMVDPRFGTALGEGKRGVNIQLQDLNQNGGKELLLYDTIGSQSGYYLIYQFYQGFWQPLLEGWSVEAPQINDPLYSYPTVTISQPPYYATGKQLITYGWLENQYLEVRRSIRLTSAAFHPETHLPVDPLSYGPAILQWIQNDEVGLYEQFILPGQLEDYPFPGDDIKANWSEYEVTQLIRHQSLDLAQVENHLPFPLSRNAEENLAQQSIQQITYGVASQQLPTAQPFLLTIWVVDGPSGTHLIGYQFSSSTRYNSQTK